MRIAYTGLLLERRVTAIDTSRITRNSSPLRRDAAWRHNQYEALNYHSVRVLLFVMNNNGNFELTTTTMRVILWNRL